METLQRLPIRQNLKANAETEHIFWKQVCTNNLSIDTLLIVQMQLSRVRSYHGYYTCHSRPIMLSSLTYVCYQIYT